MKISEIYQQYNIPRNLQEHMYRVAAVGQVIVDFLQTTVGLDEQVVTTELLLHDMGNIIKFDFSKHIDFSESEIFHLKKVKADFISKYGPEEHVATLTIAKELSVPEKVIDILENTGSSKLHLTIETTDWYRKVCSYADFRVAPNGVVSINQRFDDVIKRYQGREHVLADITKTEEKRQNALILEGQVQEKSSKPLSEITDTLVRPIVEKLTDYQI